AVNVWQDGVTTNLVNNGPTAVNLGDAGQGLQGLRADVFMAGTSGGETVGVNDSAYEGTRTFTLYTWAGDPTGGSVVNDQGTGGVNFQYASALSLTLETSRVDGNVVNVWQDGTTTNVVGNAHTTVNLGDANQGIQGLRGAV